MRKMDQINAVMDKLLIAGGIFYVGMAIAGAIKKHRAEKAEAEAAPDPEEQPEEPGTVEGVGATDGEYLIKCYWNDGRYGNERIFAGYTYDRSGEKWARWVNPHARWFEYDFKYYKTRQGAEKAIQELIRLGEDEWNGYPAQLSVISWEELNLR